VNPGNRSVLDPSIVCLAQIAVRHNLDPGEFFNRIVEAWNQGRSECEYLKIVCRGKGKDSAVFLFAVDSGIVAQFPVPTDVLEGNRSIDQLQAYVEAMPVRPLRAKKGMKLKIKDLRPKMREVNLRVKVLETSEPRVVHTRLGPALVSNVLIGDETGTMRLVLWNRQIDIVSEGALIEINNARVTSFRGELLLRAARYAKIKLLEGDGG